MKVVGDFHIHSKYSRAVSQKMTLENLAWWSQVKGIDVLGTGDFTHPLWFKEIKEKLEPAEPGLFKLKKQYLVQSESYIQVNPEETRFILTVEISNIYSKGGKGRRVHNIVFLPDLASAEKFNRQLSWSGNLKSDGRPILGMDSKELLKLALAVSPKTFFVPAHAWTPWFSVFGSMSGFNSLEECFEELTPQIFAIETGLSSDPAMNWRLAKLDKIALISNSDSHSLNRIAREANVFDCALSYDSIIESIKSNNPKSFLYTIEYFPEEGKYHFDGHRLCGVSLSPSQTKKSKGICPKCGKKLTIGVMNRVEELADRQEGFKKPGAVPFKNLVPLDQIIAQALASTVSSKKTIETYFNLIKTLGPELKILADEDVSNIEKVSSPIIAEGIQRVRENKLTIKPGFDGEYGEVDIFSTEELKSGLSLESQSKLF